MKHLKTFTPSLLLVVAALLLSGASYGANYALDLDHSKLEFKVKHLVISTVTGRFKEFSGDFEFDPKSSLLKTAKFDITVSSIDTGNAKRDKHLRSNDFFNSETHPKAEFTVSVPINIKKGKSTTVPGELQIRGIKKKLDLKVKFLGTVTDAWKNKKLIFEASGNFNRKDFNISWNKKLDSGGLMVSENVEIAVEAQAFLKE